MSFLCVVELAEGISDLWKKLYQNSTQILGSTKQLNVIHYGHHNWLSNRRRKLLWKFIENKNFNWNLINLSNFLKDWSYTVGNKEWIQRFFGLADKSCFRQNKINQLFRAELFTTKKIFQFFFKRPEKLVNKLKLVYFHNCESNRGSWRWFQIHQKVWAFLRTALASYRERIRCHYC